MKNMAMTGAITGGGVSHAAYSAHRLKMYPKSFCNLLKGWVAVSSILLLICIISMSTSTDENL